MSRTLEDMLFGDLGHKAQAVTRAVSAGANVAHPDANWDVTLVADVDSLDALEAYQVHPAHKEAGAYIKSVVASRVAVDFEF